MKVGSGDDAFSEDEPEPEPDETEGTDEESNDSGEEVQSVPWIFTRKNVKSGRDMVQFYLRESTSDQEDEFVEALEEELDTSVPVTDAREAAYIVAMDDPDSVAEKLEEWGFHLKE